MRGAAVEAKRFILWAQAAWDEAYRCCMGCWRTWRYRRRPHAPAGEGDEPPHRVPRGVAIVFTQISGRDVAQTIGRAVGWLARQGVAEVVFYDAEGVLKADARVRAALSEASGKIPAMALSVTCRADWEARMADAAHDIGRRRKASRDDAGGVEEARRAIDARLGAHPDLIVVVGSRTTLAGFNPWHAARAEILRVPDPAPERLDRALHMWRRTEQRHGA